MVGVEMGTVEWVEALVEGDDVFAERFGIAVAPGWAGFPEAVPYALEKSGFIRVEEIDDPDDGPIWRWERALP